MVWNIGAKRCLPNHGFKGTIEVKSRAIEKRYFAPDFNLLFLYHEFPCQHRFLGISV